MPEVIFKRDPICDRLGISKEILYDLAQVPNSPFKKIAGVWVVNLDELSEFVRNYGRKTRKTKDRCEHG